MILKIEIEKRCTPDIYQVFGCVGFWNEQGQHVYESNKAGKMGGKYSQQQAQRLPYQDFVLESLASEFKTLEGGENWPAGWKTGKGGNHLWVCNPKLERVVFIHF